MKVLAFVASLSAAACSNGSHGVGGPDGGSAGSGSADGGELPAHLEIHTSESVALIAFRDEVSADWKLPAPTSPGVFDIELTGPYRIVIVCENPDNFIEVVEYARTPADERTIDYPCVSEGNYPFTVSGEMLQEGKVFLGLFGIGRAPAPWEFDVPAAAETFDFVALFGSLTTGFEQVAIRRDLVVSGDVSLGTIDEAQEHAQPLIPTEFTAPNLDPAEIKDGFLLVRARNTVVSVFAPIESAPGWNVRLLPDSVLRPTDRQWVVLSAFTLPSSPSGQQRSRGMTLQVHAGGPTSFPLMDPAGPVTFETTTNRFAATWTSLPSYDELELLRESFSSDSPDFVYHDVVLSRAFVEAVGIATAAVDFTDIPGFKPAWQHDPTHEQTVLFTASAGLYMDASRYASVSEYFAPQSPAEQHLARPPGNAQHALQRARQLATRHERTALRRH
jgi:hypothetical protein